MNEKERELPVATPTSNDVQISKEDFSKLSYRQKFAVTEYGYLLSAEDAEVVGKMLGSITKEKDILPFCQVKGKKVLNFDENVATTDTVRDLPSINFFTIGFALLIIFDLLLLFTLSDGYAYLNYLCPITFGFLAAAFASFFISKRNSNTTIVLIIVLIVAIVVGFFLVAAVGGFYM